MFHLLQLYSNANCKNYCGPRRFLVSNALVSFAESFKRKIYRNKNQNHGLYVIYSQKLKYFSKTTVELHEFLFQNVFKEVFKELNSNVRGHNSSEPNERQHWNQRFQSFLVHFSVDCLNSLISILITDFG